MQNVFTQSIWGDEGFSAILSMKSLPDIIRIIIRDTSPPLWNISEWAAFHLFGKSEVVIRGLAFFYFALAVFFVYKIGEFIWNKKTGILAAALTFFNPFFFTYAFEGRMYSILAFGVTASMYFFLKLLYGKGEDHKKDLVGYVVATLWAMYSHHFAIFAIFIQGLWFLYEFFFGERKRAIVIFKGFVGVGIGYVPWLYPLYKQTTMVGGGFWLGTPTAKDLFHLFQEYLATGIKHDISIYAFYGVALVLILRKWRDKKKETIFFVSWFVGPIVLTWIVSQIFQSIFFNRYLLYAIPAAMLITASQGRKYSVYLLTIVLILFVSIDHYYFTHPNKLPFREMATYVKQTQEPGDYLINWNSSSHHLWETKYYGIPAPIYIPGEGELPYFVGTALMGPDDVIHKIPDKAKRVGVVTSGPIEEVQIPGYTLSETAQYKGLKFLRFSKDE